MAREKGVDCGARERGARKRAECEVMLGERGASVGREGVRIWRERESESVRRKRERVSIGRVCGE